jgi:hypothetical protein
MPVKPIKSGTPKKLAQPVNVCHPTAPQLGLRTGACLPDKSSIAQLATAPEILASATMQEFQPILKSHDPNELVDAIEDEVKRVIKGGMCRPEAMLVAQAHTLDMVFNTFAQRAAGKMADGNLEATEIYMRMALKAQSQCRTTLEALSEIKNPRSATFIKQQNVAGQQQVNNGSSGQGSYGSTRTHEKRIDDHSNKLLDLSHGQRMDKTTTGSAVSDDS